LWQTARVPRGYYVYAIGRAGHPLPEDVEAIDGSRHVEAIDERPLCAFATPVELDEYSQAVIDARARDVEWLGAIGYRHQAVMAALMRGGTIIPLRAFTLFGSDGAVRARLREEASAFTKILERVDGKQEWTLRVEFEPQRWSEALVGRVDALRELNEQIAAAPTGKAFLLRKKLDEEKKKASRDAEGQVVAEIESEVLQRLACESVAESRTQRAGAFPQISVLLPRDEEARLQELRDTLETRYAGEGVVVVLTGPWPPYSFSGTMKDER
jgi:hypothetical protein